MKHLLGLVILSLLGASIAQSIQCLDVNGNPVDWWFIYKAGSSVSDPYKGYATVYTDAKTASNGQWLVGNFNSSNAAYYTLSQIGLYGGTDKSIGYALWNDQTHWNLDGSCDDHYYDHSGYIYGHTKGNIGFDSNTGFWMTHSAPGFPYDHSLCPSNWYFPHAQTIYGQNFFCVSIKTSLVESIAQYLQYYHAYVYDSNIPSGMPNFNNFASMNFNSGSGSLSFSSLAGTGFKAYGKNSATNSDLYEDYVAPGLNLGLNVECWCGGTFGDDCAPSYCKGAPITNPSGPQSGQSNYAYDVVTVEQLNFGPDLTFATKYNHGKFALSNKSGSPIYCASDINRETTQRKRGGGAVCFQNAALYGLMSNSISQLNTTCPQ